MESGHDAFLNSTILLTVFAGSCVLLLMYIIRMLKSDHETVDKVKYETKSARVEKQKESSSATSKSKKKNTDTRWTGRTDKQNYSHPWLLTTFKGHSGQVLDMDFSSHGKYLASCAEDRTVILWDTKNIAAKEHKSFRVNIDYDYASLVKWSPDRKAFVVNRATYNQIQVHKVEKKKDGWFGQVTKASTFPKVHEEDVIGLGIAGNGRYVMSCSKKTDLVLMNLHGHILTKIDTYLMYTSCAKISPCGKYIAASGFAPEAKIWEVCFTKNGEFIHAKRAFELTGHTSQIFDVAFDAQSSKMATVSKDGTWKVYNIHVEYMKGEDPKLVRTGQYDYEDGEIHIALSPNAEVVVISVGNSLSFYSVFSGNLDITIEGIYSGPITSVMFDSSGKFVLTSGDKFIRVFHNVTGYKCDLFTAKTKLSKNNTSATKERLENIVANCKKFLLSIEK